VGVIGTSGSGSALYVGVGRVTKTALGRWCSVICGVSVLCLCESGAHGVYCILKLATCDVTPEGVVSGGDNCVRVEECVLCGVEFGEDFHPLAVNLCERICEFLYVRRVWV